MRPPLTCGYVLVKNRRGYIIVDRVGIRVVRDNLTKPGWVRFYVYKRVGGATLDTNAIKLQKVST